VEHLELAIIHLRQKAPTVVTQYFLQLHQLVAVAVVQAMTIQLMLVA
jgi:hypothetical protein